MKYAIVAADTFALGPAYLISHLREYGHEIRLIFDPMQHSQGGTKDTLLSRIFSVEEYNIKQIEKFKPDAVLFSCLTAHYQWALRFARKVKDETGYKIIFGGVHVTSVPEVVKENKFIDEICIGCGIEYFGIKFQPDKIFPAWEDFYAELPPCHRIHPFIMTEFGCPFNCTYCLPRNLKIRYPRREISGCINELLALKKLGAKRFSIWDDSFTHDKKWLNLFLTDYKKFIKLPFRCLTNPKLVDGDIVTWLSDAGCYTIDMGIQTGSEILRKTVLNRHETNSDFFNACKLIKSSGIKLIIDHIFEIPEESNETNKESYQLYKLAKPDLIHCFKLLYFPKAKIIETALKYGYLTQQDVHKIEHGTFTLYASGENQRVAKINPWVKKMLAIPLGGVLWEKMPDWLIKLVCYLRIGKDFLPQTIIQNQIYFTWRRLCRILK
jgi:anaerobic magnesium-protoporphyrin IX monomethyl ester cyclase